MDIFTELFLGKRKVSKQLRKWEGAIFLAGVEYGRQLQRDIDSHQGDTGVLSENQVEKQIVEIVRRAGF